MAEIMKLNSFKGKLNIFIEIMQYHLIILPQWYVYETEILPADRWFGTCLLMKPYTKDTMMRLHQYVEI